MRIPIMCKTTTESDLNFVGIAGQRIVILNYKYSLEYISKNLNFNYFFKII